MQRLKSKSEIKYLEKIARNRITNSSKFFRRNLHINHVKTNIKIVRVKNKTQFFYDVKGSKEFEPFICYFLYHLSENDLTKGLGNVKDSDIIFTDSTTNKIIAINEILKNYPDFINVWICKKHTSEYLKLKIDDVVFTR